MISNHVINQLQYELPKANLKMPRSYKLRVYSNSLHLCTTGRMKNCHLLIEKMKKGLTHMTTTDTNEIASKITVSVRLGKKKKRYK